MGLGNIDAGTAIVTTILFLAVWLVPIALTVWLFRTLGAMAAAQRDIARHLASIEQHLRAASGRAVT